jgi:hypothetical protein
MLCRAPVKVAYALYAAYPGTINCSNGMSAQAPRSGREGRCYIEEPSPVAQNGGEGDAAPSPVQNVPQELGQALGVEVLASLAQLARLRAVDGPADLLEPKLDEEGGGGEEDVEQQGLPCEGAAEEEQAEEEVE